MANTLKGRKVYICATPQPIDLDQAGYEGLTWVQVGHVGSVGETGTKDNMVMYDELDTDVQQKGKGIANAGDPPIEVARNPNDAGQNIMRTAGATHDIYAVKITDNDAASGYLPTTYYERGLIGGPTKPNGRQENFELEVFVIGCLQKEIVVDPVPQSVPTNAAPPTIQGASQHSGATLTALEGTWNNTPITSYDYQWQRDTAGNGTFADIAAATAKTYTLVAGDIGNAVRVEVKAHNSAGAAAAFASSMPVGLILA